MLVDFYYALEETRSPPEDGSTNIIARLRNGEPLAVERSFGDGRVVVQLTKLSSGETPLGRWTNWSLNPAFPILANELVNYLAATRNVDPLYRVGDDLVVAVEEGKYDPSFRVLLPGEGPTRPEILIEATPSGGRLTATLDDVPASGIYEVQLQTNQGGADRRDFAFNVPTGEGDLALVRRTDLDRQLAGVDYELHDASDMTMDEQHLAGFQMSDALLGVLIAVLLGEQVLAYLASYHVPPMRGSAR
jgi:hypothetical protein